MRISSDAYTIYLIKNRFFRGGRIYPVWQMFRNGQLTGRFIFSGQQWKTVIDVHAGRTTDLSYEKQGSRIQGIKGFEAFKNSIQGDASARYSVLVLENVEKE